MNLKPFVFLVLACASSTACSSNESKSLQSQQTTTTAQAVQQDEFVQTPSGAKVPRGSVHEIPNGAGVDENGGVWLHGAKVADYGPPIKHDGSPPCPPPTSCPAGAQCSWVMASQATTTSSAPFTKLTASWVVPPTPAHLPTAPSNMVLYYFPAIDDLVNGQIVQPVLQWGWNGAFGSESTWSIAAWYGYGCDASTYYHTNSFTVHPGDSISGYVTNIGPASWCTPAGGNLNNNCWAVEISDDTTQNAALSYFTELPNSQWTVANLGALEEYDFNNCMMLPACSGSCGFSYNWAVSGDVYTGMGSARTKVLPTWSAKYYANTGPSCGYSVAANSELTQMMWTP